MMMMMMIIIVTLFKSQWIYPSIVALLTEETTNQTESQQIKSKQNYCWFLVRRENWSNKGKALRTESIYLSIYEFFDITDLRGRFIPNVPVMAHVHIFWFK